jgi:periplasmic divalent cation tolerance protein
MNPRLVYVTALSLDEARLLAQKILESRLAACANLIPGVESHYWWQGKLETAPEVLLMIKSSAEQFEALSDLIRRHHS